MRFILVLLLFMSFCLEVFGQYSIEDQTSRIQKKFTTSKKHYKKKDYKRSLKILKSIQSQVDSCTDVHALQAEIFADLRDWKRAKSHLEMALSLEPNRKNRWYLWLANYCKKLNDKTCELKNLMIFQEQNGSEELHKKIDRRIKNLQFQASFQSFDTIKLEKLSTAINMEHADQYWSRLNAKGDQMVFVRRVNGQEDLYVAQLVNGKWQEAQPLASLNTAGNEGAHAFSPDGHILLLTLCNVPNQTKDCDLYITSIKGNTTTKLVSFGNLNSYGWDSQPTFGTDGNTIMFSSARKGSKGKDIYISTYTGTTWTTPEKLSDAINTGGDECAPFLHPDGRTLYFMSTGHQGFGGYDLFMSRKNVDGNWSKPINLGPSINTSGNEGALSIDLKGEFAYFSKADSLNRNSIYRFQLPDAFKPLPVSYLQVLVKDKHANNGMPAMIHVTDTVGVQRAYKIPKEGTVIVLNSDMVYQVQVEKTGYLFFSERLYAQESQRRDPIHWEIALVPITNEAKSNTPYILKNVLFKTGESKIQSGSELELMKLLNILKENPSLRIQINGHTDDIGDSVANKTLSKNRAASVKEYLVQHGIDTGRIQTVGYGDTKPLVPNTSETNRMLNRRTEFEIIE